MLWESPLETYAGIVIHHNHIRPHAALGERTSVGYLRKHHGKSLRRNLATTDPGEKTSAGKIRQKCQM